VVANGDLNRFFAGIRVLGLIWAGFILYDVWTSSMGTSNLSLKPKKGFCKRVGGNFSKRGGVNINFLKEI